MLGRKTLHVEARFTKLLLLFLAGLPRLVVKTGNLHAAGLGVYASRDRGAEFRQRIASGSPGQS